MKELLKNFICSWICCWLIFYPTLSYADDKVVVGDPVPISAGQVAPFSGVLFPTLKAAQLTAQLESSEASCTLKTKKEVDLAVSIVQLKLDNCSSSRIVLEDMYKTQIQSQKEYIEFLEKKSTTPKLSSEVIFIIGIVAGVGITIGAGYAMHQAAQ
jgi:hypothetical protein